MKKVRLLFLLSAFIMSITAFAQSSGTVTDENGDPIIGASVIESGNAKNGTVTDIDGHFTIDVAEGRNLVISYIGYETQTVPARRNMTVVLKEDHQMLSDVVVIGYGVQKKSVVTASIAKVAAEDLEGKSPVRVDNALKGLAAGVNVTSSSGQPGAAPKVRIRGAGTINDSDPLYIVDGMPMGQGGIDYLNPNDIESIEVLKDAASGAIYGSRAANGVILVTTKKGKKGKANISYNFSQGWQSSWRKRDVTSATDYAILQNEMYVNGGSAPLYADPYHLTDANGDPINGFGTDWQELVFNDNAPVQNHDVSVSGATDKLNYFLSMGYYTQEGIVGGNYGKSNYNRMSLRSNNIYNVYDMSDERNFLNKLDITVNLSYSRIKATGISENSEWGTILGSALYMSPLLPVTLKGDIAQRQIDNYASYDLLRDANGDPYTIPNYLGSYQEMNNPVAMLAVPETKNWTHKFVPQFVFDLQLWDNLKYHFNYSADLAFWGSDGAVRSLYYLSGNNKQEHTSASASKYQSTTWQLENTLTYDKTFGDHSFAVVLGQSAMKSKGDYLSGNRWNLVNPDKPSINYATGDVVDGIAQFGVAGAPWAEHTLSSLFARLSYNYAERYMLQATVRRDGSSRFGTNNRYATFPSVSLGWNLRNEPFMDGKASWLSTAKLRASWGKNGNESIGDFRYTVLTAMGNNVLLGKDALKYIGSKANGLANPDLKWEESEQTDIGIDLGFLNNALTFTADYYIKKTNGMLLTQPIPSYVGETKPIGNVGDMENSGFEFELGYKFHIADARFAIKGNATYLHNELKNLGNDTGYLDYDSVQGISGGGTRAMNGEPFPFFFGYKTDGIFQTMDEVNAYTNSTGGLIQPDARPGFVRFVDVNGDGAITPDDRTNIGNGTPTWTFGLNFNAEWKGFDFNLFLQGVSGADVLDGTYRSDVYSGNYPTWMLDRWTGPGTSNKYPMLMLGDDVNWRMSDLYIHDASYCRIKNISLGYTLPKTLTKKFFVERLRFFVMAENLATWTKYWGFDPEISSGGTSLGVDRGIYPQARTYTIGFNITF